MRLIPVIAAAALLAGCNTSYNYFEDDRSNMPDGGNPTAFGVIMGLAGMTEPQKPRIEYKARAPLAMPPKKDLPPPAEDLPNSATAEVDWPEDPDVFEERRRRANLSAGAKTEAYDNSLKESELARLSPEDIQAGRLAGGGRHTGEADQYASHRPEVFRMSPRELAKTIPGLGGGNKPKLITETGEVKPRQYLVEPPDAYRTPSDSAPLPDPKDIENSEWAKKRLYGQDDRRPPRAQR